MADEIEDGSPLEDPDGDKVPEYVKEIEKKNAQIFERFKKAEEKIEKIGSAVENLTEEVKKTPSGGNFEIDKFLEVKSATDGLDAQEISTLRMIANAKGISLADAKKDEDFALWQSSYKAKVEKENVKDNAPLPSTTQTPSEIAKSLKDMTLEERQKKFEEMGLIKKAPKR